jgi:hypothetical protein
MFFSFKKEIMAYEVNQNDDGKFDKKFLTFTIPPELFINAPEPKKRTTAWQTKALSLMNKNYSDKPTEINAMKTSVFLLAHVNPVVFDLILKIHADVRVF